MRYMALLGGRMHHYKYDQGHKQTDAGDQDDGGTMGFQSIRYW